jgi:hypothetical protein
MTPSRKSLTSLFLVGALATAGAACGSSSDSSDSDSSADSIAEWCATWEEFDASEEEAGLGELTGMLDTLAKTAPAEINDDMQYLASAFTEMMDAVDSMDTDAMEALEAEFDEEEIEAATERIETYVLDVCDIDTE